VPRFHIRRLFASPVRLGLAIVLVLMIAFVSSETALDRWPIMAAEARGNPLTRASEGPLRDLRIAIVHILLAGYLPAAFLAVLQGGRRTVRELQGALDCSADECERLASSIRFAPLGLALAGAVGFASAFIGPYIVPPVPPSPWNPATWSPEVIWHRTLGPFASVWLALLVYAIVAVSRRMSALAAELGSIDLFDPEPLAPFTRQGLRNALLAVGFLAIAGLMVLTETGFGVLAAWMAAVILLAAGLALLLPLRGVRGRIVREKRRATAAIDGRLGELRATLTGSRASAARSGEFADLAAYRELVRDVPEWPIGRSSFVRFMLYLLIPVASWALAALVEHLVGRYLI
jgi:hypothetical protein